MPPPSTLEAQIVRFADRIAYLNHDVDDALRAGVLSDDELPAGPMRCWAHPPERVNPLVTDLVEASEDQPEVHLTKPVFARWTASAISCSTRSTFDRAPRASTSGRPD